MPYPVRITAILTLLVALLLVGCGQDPTPTLPPTVAPTVAPTQPAAPPSPTTIPTPTALPPTPSPTVMPTPTTTVGNLIVAVRTDKAMYAPGTPVTITVELDNRLGATYDGAVTLQFYHLGDTAADAQTQPVAALAAGKVTSLSFSWTPPATDFQGYRVEAQARDQSGAKTLDMAATAVDVSSDWKKFPRYGFVSKYDGFPPPAQVMDKLNAFHLNGIQFYDWQWQHHRPYSPKDSWPDIARRDISRQVVTGLIDAAHSHNMLAMNYNLVYGAYDNYWQDESGVKLEWGLFKNSAGNYTPEQQDFHPLPGSWASPRLYLMNPADPGWQQYIFGQEQQVFDNFAFDGWHMDTLGRRDQLWDWNRQPVDLPPAFVDFINKAKGALNKRIVFNTVGGYAQDEIASGADVDFVYTEVWENDGVRSYADLLNIVGLAQAKTDKAVVIPAYMNKGYGQSTTSGYFNEPSVRLTDVTLFAAGAAHLELGDDAAMLDSEYFPYQPLLMSQPLTRAMYDYYDFAVAYENLLRDGVSAAANKVTLDGVATSTNGAAKTVWTLAKVKSGYAIAHLINLTSNEQTLWRDDGASYPTPATLTDLPTKLYYSGVLPEGAKLHYASPDADHGATHELTYTTGSDDQGTFVTFTLPQLQYWDMVWLEQ